MYCKNCGRKIGPGCKILVTDRGRFIFCSAECMGHYVRKNDIAYVFIGRFEW
jgi:hypothetical protein